MRGVLRRMCISARLVVLNDSGGNACRRDSPVDLLLMASSWIGLCARAYVRVYVV